MHLFDSARPSSHHHKIHEIQKSSVLTAFFLRFLRILQGLAAVSRNFGSIKTTSETAVPVPRRRRCCPGAKVFCSPATEARAPAPMSFSWRQRFIKLPLLLSGSSEDSTESSDHDDTSHKCNSKENQYVDAKEPMKAFHALFSRHAGRNTFGSSTIFHVKFPLETFPAVPMRSGSSGISSVKPEATQITDIRRIVCMAPFSVACLSWKRLDPTKKIIQ